MPYLISFEDVQIGDTWYYVDTSVDILFFFDLIITFNTAIIMGTEELDNIRLIKKRKEIACIYLKGSFLIDLVSIFPFYIFN